MTTPTPRTDKAIAELWHNSYEYVLADFARQLELELAEAKAEKVPTQWAYDQACAALHKCEAERDKLRAALQWYATATYPDDGSGRPPDAFRQRAQAALAPEEGK